jgi:TPR repeat protein
MCYFGSGVERDVPRAVACWTAAAAQGLALAQYNLGNTAFWNVMGCAPQLMG